MNNSFRRDTCRLCNSTGLQLIISLKPTPLADDYIPEGRLDILQEKYPLDLFFCRSCGCVQILDIVDPSLIYEEYVYITQSSVGLTEHFRDYANHISDRFNFEDDRLVVEIGSNDGTLLSFFKEKGYQVLGVEPAKVISQQANDIGIDTISDYFSPSIVETIQEKYQPAALIVANNVLANIDDLQPVFTGVEQLLAPDGIFVFETGYFPEQVERFVFDHIYHEHLSYFAVKPLMSFIESCGLELFDIESVDTKGGSLRFLVQKKGGKQDIQPAVGKYLEYEVAGGYDQPEVYLKFARQIDQLKAELNKLLNRLKTEGKEIAGYGASHSVTTVIHHFEIADMISFIVDDNPRKHNKFSPGFHIPVYPSDALYEKKPDYTIILPWRFGDIIIDRNQQYLEQGGSFIKYLPEVTIVSNES